jgi:hypothetical protein
MANKENQVRNLAFADTFIAAELVDNPKDYSVADGVVVNISPNPVVTGGDVPAIIPPWKSTMLRGGAISTGDRVAVIKVRNPTNLGGVGFRGWDWLGNRISSFPRDTPLYISPKDRVGSVMTDPYVFTNERQVAEDPQEFDVTLNLWWSPGDTDCFIHNEHPFLEVHTQIHGLGRMQKFSARDQSAIYEDVVMAIGYTHDPFCRVVGRNKWQYPFHRYYAETDSVWLAIELHPKA